MKGLIRMNAGACRFIPSREEITKKNTCAAAA
jgi:hypothetical protein